LRRDQGAAPGLLHRRLRLARRGYRDGQGACQGQSRDRQLRDPAGGRAPRASAGHDTEARGVNDLGWIDGGLGSARLQVIGALVLYLRDFGLAEEAFQESCLRALKTWPQNGPPRDPTAWLIFVGRNAAMDDVRRRAKQEALPDEAVLSDLEDAESALA